MEQNLDTDQDVDYSVLQLLTQPPRPIGPNIPVSEDEEKEIVAICGKTKQAMIAHARLKKDVMRTCYAYYKNQLVENDLLPLPSVGDSKSLDSQRPKAFYPIVKQLVDQLYSYVKLTFFPDDENYCRIKGQNQQSALVDEELSEGFMLILKKMKASEKLSTFIFNAIWAGNTAALPYIKRRTVWEWDIDEANAQYVPIEKELEPEIEIEAFNPVNFYLDPTVSDIEYSKWAYYSVKKVRELIDNPLYFNTDDLDKVATNNVVKNTYTQGLDLSIFNGLNSSFEDSEKNIDYDLYYFPYLKTQTREYRNMIVGVAGGAVLVRFHPNMFPKGMNPAVFATWSQDVDSQYGTGVAENIKDLQRLINIMVNFKIEKMARMDSKVVARPDVDFSNWFGIAGGIAYAENPTTDVYMTPVNMQEMANIDNSVGVMKAEAQQTAGAQDPFQGASNIDFKKTATEIQLLQSNSVTNSREKVEHLGITGVEPILTRVLYLLADIYTGPIELRKDNGEFVMVDFSVVKKPGYYFTVELVGSNPSQSKQAEVESWTELVSMVAQNPQGLLLVEPLIKKIAELQGIKDIDQVLEDLQGRIASVLGAGQPAVPAEQDGMGAMPQPPMGGIPQAVA